MVKFIQTILGLFHKHKDKLPEDMDSLDEMKAKAQELMDQHGDKIDDVTEKIPGETDDKIVDQARDVLKK